MSIFLHTKAYDTVIDSMVVTGETNYNHALQKIVPQIDKLEIQRKIQDKKFYEKLERDIYDGCIMPPITLALINKEGMKEKSIDEIQEYIRDNIEKSFVLDGIQRLNTLLRASKNEKKEIDLEQILLLNIIICQNQDKLLYRMITLNNGQRPMTPRHQIEILTKNVFNFDEINIPIQTEKERQNNIIVGSFKNSDIVKAYLAFLTNSVNIENKKIIDEKMDQLLVGKIFESSPKNYDLEFSDVLNLLERIISNKRIMKWLKVNNNLLGFTLALKQSYYFIKSLDIEQIEEEIEKFEYAFSIVNPSKVKLGKVRRELSLYYFKNIENFIDKTSDEVGEIFMEETAE